MRTIAIANQARITTAVGDDGCRPAGSRRLPLRLFVGSTESRPTEIFLRSGASWRLVNMMPSYDHESEKNWDEYDWERFLQQQDHKTEKYMELLEKYLDDPNRDQIIAREMGWTQLLDGRDWTQEVDALLEEEEEEKPTPGDSFEEHSLY